MSQSVLLITGANRGLGFELSRQLLRMGGHHVIAASRLGWKHRAGSSRDQLLAAHTESQRMPTRHLGGLDFVELDVSSPRSRYELLGQLASILGATRRLTALINSAGVYPSEASAPIFESCLATNALGPLHLALELAPLYAAEAQVINVTSGYGKTRLLSDAYRGALEASDSLAALERLLVYRPDDPMFSAPGASSAAEPLVASAASAAATERPIYKISKAALNRGTQLLAAGELRSLARINCVDPGWCRTDMGGPSAPRSSADGARSIYAILVGAARVRGTGRFFDSAGKETPWA